jgi:two-component system phosphate regulon response regulator PhoB
MELARILIVEHEASNREALVTCMRMVGFDAHAAESARAARVWLTTQSARLIVIASNLPDGSITDVLGVDAPTDPGIAVVLQPPSDTLSARARPRVQAHFKRPVSVQRLVDHVEGLVLRIAPQPQAPIAHGPLRFDVSRSIVASDAGEVPLGPTEAKLMAFLLANPDRVFSRSDLLRRVWPGTVRVEERTVDVHIGRLRHALAEIAADTYVQTVRRTGYRFSLRTT